MRPRLLTKLCKCCGDIKDREAFGTLSKKAGTSQIAQFCKSCTNGRKFVSTKKQYFQNLVHNLKNNAKKKSLVVDVTYEYLLEQFTLSHRCAVSGMAMVASRGQYHSASVDRIDSAKGYTKDNIQLVCLIVNRMKSDLPLVDFLNWCKYVGDNYESLDHRP